MESVDGDFSSALESLVGAAPRHRKQASRSKISQNKSVSSQAVKRGQGRWTPAEHSQFLLGYQLHGKLWRNIVPMVPTRTAVQIRTHAQKYFLALHRGSELKANDAETDLEYASSSSDSSSSGTKPRGHLPSCSDFSQFFGEMQRDFTGFTEGHITVSSLPLLPELDSQILTTEIFPEGSGTLFTSSFPPTKIPRDSEQDNIFYQAYETCTDFFSFCEDFSDKT